MQRQGAGIKAPGYPPGTFPRTFLATQSFTFRMMVGIMILFAIMMLGLLGLILINPMHRVIQPLDTRMPVLMMVIFIVVALALWSSTRKRKLIIQEEALEIFSELDTRRIAYKDIQSKRIFADFFRYFARLTVAGQPTADINLAFFSDPTLRTWINSIPG